TIFSHYFEKIGETTTATSATSMTSPDRVAAPPQNHREGTGSRASRSIDHARNLLHAYCSDIGRDCLPIDPKGRAAVICPIAYVLFVSERGSSLNKSEILRSWCAFAKRRIEATAARGDSILPS